MSKEAIRKCIELVGTQKALADRMKPFLPAEKADSFRQGHISNWLNRELVIEVPPVEYVEAMAKAVDGQLTPAQIRPDVAAIFCKHRNSHEAA